MATFLSSKETEHVAASEASKATSSTPSVNESSDHIRVRDKQPYSTIEVASSTEQQCFDDDYETDTIETHGNENCTNDVLTAQYVSLSADESHTLVPCLETAKSVLKVNEFKKFQVDCAMAIKEGKDVVIVQPTGSGKSMYFILPALILVSLVIEPVIAVIINQIDALQKKRIKALALGNAVGMSKVS